MTVTRPDFHNRGCLLITLWFASFFVALPFQLLAKQRPCWIILLPMCRARSKQAQWEKTAPLKPCLGTRRGIISCSRWWHQHMCTKPIRLHAWAFEWVEKEIESENVWREKERRGAYMAFMYLWQLYFQDCLRAILHAFKFVGCSQLGIKHPDAEVYLYREVMKTVTVLPLKPCVYALLMKFDGGTKQGVSL